MARSAPSCVAVLPRRDRHPTVAALYRELPLSTSTTAALDFQVIAPPRGSAVLFICDNHAPRDHAWRTPRIPRAEWTASAERGGVVIPPRRDAASRAPVGEQRCPPGPGDAGGRPDRRRVPLAHGRHNSRSSRQLRLVPRAEVADGRESYVHGALRCVGQAGEPMRCRRES